MEMLTLSFPPHYIEPVCAENPIRVDRGRNHLSWRNDRVALFRRGCSSLGSPFRSKLRLEAQNAVLQGASCKVASGSRTMIAGSLSNRITGFSHPEGSYNHPARDARALAQGRLSLLLALEVTPTGRATADRDRAARIDPADERRKSALGCATHSRRTVQALV